MARIAGIWVLSFAALALAPRTAGARDTEAKAKASFDAGVELFEAGKYAEAALAFGRAYEIKPAYKILYNLGQTEAELGRHARALKAYSRYLAEGGSGVPAQRLQSVKTEIKRLNALVGMLVVTSEVDGAEVFIDDERQGETPLPGTLFVDIGEHLLVVRKEGAELHRERLGLAGGERVELRVKAARAVVPAPAAEGSGGEAAPAGERRRVWTWVAAGLGGAGLVGAVVTGSLALTRKGDVVDRCDGKDCPSSLADDFDAVERLNLTTDVLIGVAAAGAAAAVVLFFVEPGLGREEDVPVETVGLTPLPGGAALTLGGRF